MRAFLFTLIAFAVLLHAENQAAPDSAKTAKSSGLLEALFAVEPDESIAKGHILTGATFSLIQGSTDDDALDIIIGDIYKAEGSMFSIEAFGGYFIRDALALGIRGGYSRTKFDIDFTLLEDLGDLKQHRQYVSNGFFLQPFVKNYLKVLDSRTVYLFNETSVSFGYSYGISQTDDGEDLNKTRSNTWSIRIGLDPGLCIMILNGVAIETSVGLLGFTTSVIEVEENNETHSEVVYNIANFSINLLALDLSLVYFF